METPVRSDRLCALPDVHGAEGSPSFSIARRRRHAIGITLSRDPFNNHVVSSSLFILGNLCGNLCLGNLLHDLKWNLLEMSSGVPFMFLFHGTNSTKARVIRVASFL